MCGRDVTGVLRGIVGVDVCDGCMVLVLGMIVFIEWVVGSRESEGVVDVVSCCVVCVGSADVTIVVVVNSVGVWVV